MIWGEGASTCMSQGWPELYIYNVHDRIFRDSLAGNAVYTMDI